jgi:hypothetical protein
LKIQPPFNPHTDNSSTAAVVAPDDPALTPSQRALYTGAANIGGESYDNSKGFGFNKH